MSTALNGDDKLVVFFKQQAVPNDGKSAAAGRPIYDDMEVVEIRGTGKRDTSIQPATMHSHWGVDQQTGFQRSVTYAERFSRQYRQYKEHQTQTISGTPLTHAPFVNAAIARHIEACGEGVGSLSE